MAESRRTRAGPVLALLLGSCGGLVDRAPAGDAAVGPSDAGRHPELALGERWLDPAVALPARAEVVAVSDRLSIASARAGKTLAGAELAMRAAALRERLWRLDRASTDGREAAELYAAVAAAAPSEPLRCQAELRRAVLAGEMARDATLTFREAFLAQARVAATSPAGDGCVRRIEQLIADTEAFRPQGTAWVELEAEAQRQPRGQAPVPATASADSAAAALAAPAASLFAGPAGREVVVLPDVALLGSDPVKLTAVDPYSWEGGGRVVLTLTAAARYEVGVLSPDVAAGRGHRIYLDLLGVRGKGGPREVKGLVKQVRLGRQPNGTRVVVDLSAPARHRVFYLPDPFRVVIDLTTRVAETAAASTDKGKRSVRRVTLDAGHGGWDTGAIGSTGLREKDVTLDVVHRAAPALATELGVETMLARDSDAFVALAERTARANAFHSDLFVSVHCNATEDGNADGVEVYILDPSRALDAAALRAMTLENLVEQRGRRPPDPRVLDAQVARVAAGLNVSDTTARARLFAQLLRRSTTASLDVRYGDTRDHGVKTAGFLVLLGADMPAVLYETAFISNAADEARLATADYRQKLADAIVNAVRAYQDGRAVGP